MRTHVTETFYGLSNPGAFYKGISESINSLSHKGGIYFGDNLYTINRNLSFFDDEKFVKSFSVNAETEAEKSIAWRMAVVLWGFQNGLKLQGDFVGCACDKGTTARIICDTLGFYKYKDRNYYLYDLFERDESDIHHVIQDHNEDLLLKARKRFSNVPNVVVTKGRVPEVLKDVSPEKIAFMHLDLNNAGAEIGALELLFDRMAPGAVMVLDHYGWLAYREQKLAEDEWLGKRGYRVLELPTGQGLVIK